MNEPQRPQGPAPVVTCPDCTPGAQGHFCAWHHTMRVLKTKDKLSAARARMKQHKKQESDES